MSLKLQLIEDMKQAMKAHESERLGAIRYGLSEIKRIEIDAGELPDPEAQKVLAKLIKQAEESIVQYRLGKREDLVQAEEFKVKVWQAYLPEALSETELTELIKESIESLDQPQFGQVMSLVIKKVAGRADGQKVAQVVKSLL